MSAAVADPHDHTPLQGKQIELKWLVRNEWKEHKKGMVPTFPLR